VQDVSGPALEPGEDPVRLAHHQARGQTHQTAAGIREGEGPDRGLCGAQGAERVRRQPAQDRQDRASGQAGRAKEELTGKISLTTSCPAPGPGFRPARLLTLVPVTLVPGIHVFYAVSQDVDGRDMSAPTRVFRHAMPGRDEEAQP